MSYLLFWLLYGNVSNNSRQVKFMTNISLERTMDDASMHMFAFCSISLCGDQKISSTLLAPPLMYGMILRFCSVSSTKVSGCLVHALGIFRVTIRIG